MSKISEPTYKICYTIDYRGDNDDILTFLVRGAKLLDISNVFLWLAKGGNAFESFSHIIEYDIPVRNGMSTFRDVIVIKGHHSTFCSVDDLCLLFESRMKALRKCQISKFSMSKFLNI